MLVSADFVLPIDAPPIAGGAVAIERGTIAAVGTVEELGAPDLAFEDAAIVPGFVNAHTHLEYAGYAGFGDGLPFAEWLPLHIERKGRVGWDEHLALARRGAADCLASGVTTVGDASYSGAAGIACAELGLRAIVYVEVFKLDPEAALARFAEVRGRLEGALSDRVELGISPHAPYSTSNEVYAAARELGLPVATHLSESRAELDWLVRGEGPMKGFVASPPGGSTGVRRLDADGLLGPWLTAAHCVLVDEDEIALLAERDVAVAHCPRSNALLGCGIAPLAELRAAGIRVGLGTDSPASAPSFDMFDELRAAVLVARARERRADALSAADALELATLGSARALGLAEEVGSIAPGKRADLTVISLFGSPYLPWEDPAAAVVFGGSPDRVLATLVGGEARYEKGGSEWHEELRSNAGRARSRMLGDGIVPAAAHR